jgi:ferredoxin
MTFVRIDQNAWEAGLARLAAVYRLFGPVKEGSVHEFKALDAGQRPDMNYLNTRRSPKALIYPQSEKMFDFSLDETQADHNILREAEKDYTPRAVIGIRPCDADAFLLVRKNFDTPEYRDPYWVKAYEATTLVGLACSAPCSTCFCTTAGSGPFHEAGLDLLLVEEDGTYLAKVLTPKGAALVEAAGWGEAADAAAAEGRLQELRAAAEERIVSRVPTAKLKDQEINPLFDAPFWQEVAFSCINCGTCTYVCPTCWCFDIQDEVHGKKGIRYRNWDSCMYPLFTYHGSGHNPRSQKTQRVRQRFMHKLKYFVDKYDDGIQCVGCGRCIRLCPVNIDIRRVCNLMNNFDATACAIPAA